jgi:hypothetical protein
VIKIENAATFAERISHISMGSESTLNTPQKFGDFAAGFPCCLRGATPMIALSEKG